MHTHKLVWVMLIRQYCSGTFRSVFQWCSGISIYEITKTKTQFIAYAFSQDMRTLHFLEARDFIAIAT